jgi:ligand-binding SRPBCC domain-containing protein
MQSVDAEFWLPVSIDKVWELFSDPKNLVKISPSYIGIEIQGNPLTLENQLVELNIKPLGLPWSMPFHTRIQHVVDQGAERQFVDTLEKGFFAHWRHTHKFVSGDLEFKSSSSDQKIKIKEAGTWVIDHVDYELPLGPLNTLANKLIVKNMLSSMFLHRKKALTEIFNS